MRPRHTVIAGITTASLALVAAAASASATTEPAPAGGESITVMIGSSGPAESAAVDDAVEAWQAASGNSVELIVADDMALQLGQALAGGDPPDVFYVSGDKFQEYASGGSLAPIGDLVTDPEDFYPALSAVFTYDDQLYCAPKDFSTLALVINTDVWEAAGLTDADIPESWDELADVAATLTTDGQVGLATHATRDRVGALFVAGGGYFVNEDQTEVTADTPENLATMEFIKSMLDADSWEFTENMDLTWGGEAFGTGASAMTIEGNWIRGAMTNDYPDINYTVVELPVGPSGNRGSMAFTQCWGVAAASDQQDVAVDFVNFMTAADQQVNLANAFGVLPSRQSAADAYLADNPDMQPFLAAVDYSRGQVTLPNFTPVLVEFDKQLLAMANGDAEPADVLADLQTNGEDALAG